MICGLGTVDKKMFYFDDNLKKYEAEYSWDESLLYLENKYLDSPTCEKLNSLVGFSWYYLIEGPIDSGKYEKDENYIALDIWKKYLSIGFEEYNYDSRFCFIAGYSLSLHGFYIEEYKNNYERIGIALLNRASNSNVYNFKKFVSIIIEHQEQRKYSRLKIKKAILDEVFCNDSLLEKYFKEIYS